MSRSRAPIIAIIIVSLICGGLTRCWADYARGGAVVARSGQSSLSGMDSYALALLLGGLRGPLVMFLWTSSESLKNDSNLEDFDSMVEWIRLLQPEFDTVHIFQIWNKAYNISAKMTNVGNKYTTILDALDYAHKVDAERPNNINIVAAIAGLFAEKLGTSTESPYYRQRVRQETLYRPTEANPVRNDLAARRIKLDPMLDSHFNILPHLLEPRQVLPLDPAYPSMKYDGSELQFLAEFQPFPHGLSALALGYNYSKRAQLLQLIGRERHAQFSDTLVDSRPALAMRDWADDDWELGRRAELQAFGKAPPAGAERLDFETTAAEISLQNPINDRSAIDRAIFDYDRAAMLCGRADIEFAQHVARFKENESKYASHRLTAQANQQLCAADRDYLRAMVASADSRADLIQSATAGYIRAANLNRVIILRFYVDDNIAEKTYPKGVTRLNVSESSPDLDQTERKAVVTLLSTHDPDDVNGNIGDYRKYIDRAVTRLALLGATAPTTAPN